MEKQIMALRAERAHSALREAPSLPFSVCSVA